MSTRFRWKNRKAFIRRVYVYITCTTITLDEAIDRTLDVNDRYGYCDHPDQMTVTQRENIMKEVSYMRENPIQASIRFSQEVASHVSGRSKRRGQPGHAVSH